MRPSGCREDPEEGGDLECGSTTHTAARGKEVSFSISHCHTGTRLLVRGGSDIRNGGDLAGKAVSSVTGSTNEAVLRRIRSHQ